MPNPNWPNGLPSPYAASEPQYTPSDNTIRSQTETGPAKVRRRFTGKHEKLSFALELTGPQRVIFMSFFETTLGEVGPFDWTDLRTGTVQTYRFTKRPGERWVAGDTVGGGQGWWRLEIELETIL